MKVKFNATLSGTKYVFHSGDIVDLSYLKKLGMSEDEVKRLLDVGICSAVAKKIEKAELK